ncbi:MAG: hypothetical protein ACKOZU_03615 [Planctomycetaceae bacterium]
MPLAAGIWIVAGVLVAAATVQAQGPGGAPGMPMQRLGPSRGQATGMGTPGSPMARMGRSGGMPQASPTRRSYGGFAGVPGVMSSQQFRGSNLAGQYSGRGMQRSSAGIIGGVTRGAVTLPSSSR